MVERQFRAMGSVVRLLIAPSPDAALPPPGAMAMTVQAWLLRFEQTLSRFREDSELASLNRDPREEVPASALLREAVQAAVWAAELSEGLVDPTLAQEVADAGYAESRAGVESAPIAEALAAAPARHPAAARPNAPWRELRVLDGAVRRPPGVQLDAGGIGKGLAADMLGRRLAPYPRFVIDCGGDLLLGGAQSGDWPVDVEVRDPLTGDAAATFEFGDGAVATSGLDSRLWRKPDGAFAHHLIDPATGAPAWTGLVAATALAASAVEAEALAKAALLSGPDRAQRFLSRYGGFTIDERGSLQRICGELLP